MDHQYLAQPNDYYNAPIPSHPSGPSMLFSSDVRPQTYPSAHQPTHSQPQLDDHYNPHMDRQGLGHPQPQPYSADNNIYLDGLSELDVRDLYPAFLSQRSSPSPALPAAPQHVYPGHSPQHLSPAVPSIRTGGLAAYSPTPGLSAGPSTPYGVTTPSPTSPYPSSPELLRTPITPYTMPRHDMVGIYAPGASPASSVDPPLLWPQPKEGRPRAPSDPRTQPNPAGRGLMVPQKRYRPHTTSDRRRYVEEVELEPSIVFSTLRPTMDGFALSDALSGKFAQLAQRDDQMFNDRGPSISVRINWPGFNSWSRQIPTRDFRNPPGPITRAKLAKNVAKSVGRFITEQQGKPMDEDADPRWQVGPRGIQLQHLALVRLDHVSKGSWQAQLCLVDPNARL